MAVLDLGKVVPEKGIDYLTESDINEIVADVKNDIKVSDLDNDAGYITKNVNDLTYYTLATDTGHTIDLSINSSTYVMTLDLKNSAGTVISTDSIDLPLESVVVNGSYDSTNKKIILTLQSGNTIEIPVGDLVSGLQSEITSQSKLSSDLVDDTDKTNKFVTASEKTTWNGKQDALTAGTNITIQNNVISATGGGGSDLPIYVLETNRSIWDSATTINASNDATAISTASDIINALYNTTSKFGCILFHSTATNYHFLFLSYGPIATNKTSFGFYSNSSAYSMSNGGKFFTYRQLSINGSWNNEVFTCTSISYDVPENYVFSNFVDTNTYQTISGQKTFTTLPESSVTPTTNNQLVNKSYVDSAISNIPSGGGGSGGSSLPENLIIITQDNSTVTVTGDIGGYATDFTIQNQELHDALLSEFDENEGIFVGTQFKLMFVDTGQPLLDVYSMSFGEIINEENTKDMGFMIEFASMAGVTLEASLEEGEEDIVYMRVNQIEYVQLNWEDPIYERYSGEGGE